MVTSDGTNRLNLIFDCRAALIESSLAAGVMGHSATTLGIEVSLAACEAQTGGEGIRDSGYSGFRAFEIPGFRDSGYSGFRYSGFRVHPVRQTDTFV